MRPHIAHCIWDGKVKYIIRSTNEIRCACFVSIGKESDRMSIQLLLGTIDGNVWSISLPMKSKKTQRINISSHYHGKTNAIGMKRQRPVPQQDRENSPFDFLQDNPIMNVSYQSMDAIEIHLLVCFPGIRRIIFDSSGKSVIMTSSLQPTTVFIDLLSPEKSYTEIELTEIEGDESTELLIVDGDDSSSLDVLYQLLPHQDLRGKLIILQGDQDGCLRHATIDLHTQRCEISGTLLNCKEPVVGLNFISLKESSSSKALLVVGRNGLLTIMGPSTPLLFCRLHVPRVSSFDYIPFLSMGCFVAKGKCFCVHLPRLTLWLEVSPSRTPKMLSLTDKNSDLIFPFPISCQDIVSISNDNNKMEVVLLNSSGHAYYFFKDQLQNAFKNTTDNDVYSAKPSTKVKALLHKIAELSTTTNTLQKKSIELDEELCEKHFALTFIEQLKESEIQSWVKCQLSLEACSTSKTASVSCYFEISQQMRNQALKFLSTWWAHVQVSNKTRKTTQNIFFKLSFLPDGSYVKSIALPQHVLRSNDGIFTIKCLLLSRGPFSNTQSCKNAATINDSSDFVELLVTPSNAAEAHSFSVPIVEETCFHVFQLSTVIIDDYKYNEFSSCGLDWWSIFKKDLIDRGLADWEKIEEKGQPNASAFEMTIEISSQIDSQDKAALLLIVVIKVMEALLDEVRVKKNLLPQIKRETNSGKILLLLRSINGSVTVLKFAHSNEDKIQLHIHASDPIDLCIIRTLLIEKLSMKSSKNIHLVDLVKDGQLHLQYSYSTLDKAEQILMELEEKKKGKIIFESDICHKELVSNTIQVNSMEHGILETYYSIRRQLAKIIL